jgi:membrane protease YdiL (CAAX protease family)
MYPEEKHPSTAFPIPFDKGIENFQDARPIPVMPADYSHMRSRWLLVWLVLYFSAAGTVAMMFRSDSPWFDTAMNGSLFVVLGGWALWQCRRLRFDAQALLGHFPREARIWSKILLAIPLLIAAEGCFWLLWYPLSFAAPEFTERFILQGMAPPHWNAGTPGNSLAEIAITLALAPIVEEIVYRGLLLQRWALKWGAWRALAASSVIFGFLHDDVLGAIIFGYVMGFLVIRTGGLWIPIALHAFYNAITVALEFVPWAHIPTNVREFRDAWPYGLASLLIGCTALYLMRKQFLPQGPLAFPRPAPQGDPSASAVAV